MTDREKQTGKQSEKDPQKNSAPRSAGERSAPRPVRPETVQEEEGVAPSRQEDPPKAEGNRDEVDDDADRD